MKEITCVGLIPAEGTADPGKGLNVLVLAVNHAAREATASIALYGQLDGQKRELVARECTLAPNDHAHLYFYIPPRCFSPDFWDGEIPEEMTLYAGAGSPETGGELIFIS